MSSVHASLTGANLHEPKGVESAINGQAYIANGSGSGSWTTVTGLTITGMIADFMTPIAPSGWLELNGASISSSTYSALYNAVTIQTTGSRTSGDPHVTSIPSTTNIKAGYFVLGTGFSIGTTVLSVDSATQVTLSNNSSSTTSGDIAFSPWVLGSGTFTLPDLKTSGRYRRSRTSSLQMGTSQADSNKSHTHTGTSDSTTASHTHTGTSDSGGAHTHTVSTPTQAYVVNGVGPGGVGAGANATGAALTADSGGAHTHTFTTNSGGAAHTHTFTTGADGGSETRPLTMVVMTCVKT